MPSHLFTYAVSRWIVTIVTPPSRDTQDRAPQRHTFYENHAPHPASPLHCSRQKLGHSQQPRKLSRTTVPNKRNLEHQHRSCQVFSSTHPFILTHSSFRNGNCKGRVFLDQLRLPAAVGEEICKMSVLQQDGTILVCSLGHTGGRKERDRLQRN